MIQSSNLPTPKPLGDSFSATTLVRSVGVLVLLCGLFIGSQVVQKAWQLFDSQELIVSVAKEVNQHSNIDPWVQKLMSSPNFEKVIRQAAGQGWTGSKDQAQAGDSELSDEEGAEENFRPSYILAWIITIVLLSLIARISLWAMSTGGKIALYGVEQQQELKKLLKELILERKEV